MSKHISEQYDVELHEIKARIMEMGGLVEQQVEYGCQALVTHDITLAQQVCDDDQKINQLEVELDEQCVQIIAKRQPTAGDLRTLISIMRAITDLERIGDEADRIAKMAKGMAKESVPEDQYRDFRNLTEKVRKQLRQALDAFARLDAESAVEVIRGDEEIDQDYRQMVKDLLNTMAADTATINRSMNTIWAARALERIGDHAKNLGEYVVYRVRGEDVRHGHADAALDSDD